MRAVKTSLICLALLLALGWYLQSLSLNARLPGSDWRIETNGFINNGEHSTLHNALNGANVEYQLIIDINFMRGGRYSAITRVTIKTASQENSFQLPISGSWKFTGNKLSFDTNFIAELPTIKPQISHDMLEAVSLRQYLNYFFNQVFDVVSSDDKHIIIRANNGPLFVLDQQP